MFKKLVIRNFRNFSELAVEFVKGINIFVGDNGQGKTNLLESLYILSTGNSFRYADNENLIGKGAEESVLKTTILHGDFDYDVQISILKSRKNIFIQGKKVSAGDLIQKFPAVIFSPESLSAIKEGADQRRQLVDDFLVTFNSQNSDLIQEFRKCLKTRNKVLRDLGEAKGPKNQNYGVLESLNPIFLRLGTQVSFQRTQALKALLPEINNAMQNISRKNGLRISVQYLISGDDALEFSSENIQEIMERRLIELNAAEVASGTSLVGPQKHDIRFLYDENDSRFYCSQGQQRALILSFKMAQIVYHRRVHGAYPVLMLDDVLSELDSEKRESLISFLTGIETQIFITTTDISLPTNLQKELDQESGSSRCSVFRISPGRIS